MYKESTTLEKFLIVIMTLSLIGYIFLKKVPLRDMLDFLIGISIFLILFSRTWRFWKSINLTMKAVFLLPLLLVLIGAFIFRLQDRMTGLIVFLPGPLVHTFLFEKVLRQSLSAKKADEAE